MLQRPPGLQRLRRSGGRSSTAVMGRVPRPPPSVGRSALSPLVERAAEATAAARPSTPQPQPQQPQRPKQPEGQEGQEQDVPSTLPGLLRAFFSEPSILGASALIAATASARLSLPSEPGFAEPALCLSAAALWSVSEWAIHRHLLHPSTPEEGGKPLDPLREELRRTHEHHHLRPYLHVSVDGPGLIAAFMLGTAALWLAVFALCGALDFSGGLASGLLSSPAFLSFLTSYWISGLLYEYVHCAVHTKFVPRGGSWPARYLRSVRRHHILHHCRSEAHWLAFTVPQVDGLFGTLPAMAEGQGGLPAMTPMARRAAQSWRGKSDRG